MPITNPRYNKKLPDKASTLPEYRNPLRSREEVRKKMLIFEPDPVVALLTPQNYRPTETVVDINSSFFFEYSFPLVLRLTLMRSEE